MFGFKIQFWVILLIRWNPHPYSNWQDPFCFSLFHPWGNEMRWLHLFPTKRPWLCNCRMNGQTLTKLDFLVHTINSWITVKTVLMALCYLYFYPKIYLFSQNYKEYLFQVWKQGKQIIATIWLLFLLFRKIQSVLLDDRVTKSLGIWYFCMLLAEKWQTNIHIDHTARNAAVSWKSRCAHSSKWYCNNGDAGEGLLPSTLWENVFLRW